MDEAPVYPKVVVGCEENERGEDARVLGSRGFGPVMRLLVGSVSSRVIRQAPLPVLVVPRPTYGSAP